MLAATRSSPQSGQLSPAPARISAKYAATHARLSSTADRQRASAERSSPGEHPGAVHKAPAVRQPSLTRGHMRADVIREADESVEAPRQPLPVSAATPPRSASARDPATPPPPQASPQLTTVDGALRIMEAAAGRRRHALRGQWQAAAAAQRRGARARLAAAVLQTADAARNLEKAVARHHAAVHASARAEGLFGCSAFDGSEAGREIAAAALAATRVQPAPAVADDSADADSVSLLELPRREAVHVSMHVSVTPHALHKAAAQPSVGRIEPAPRSISQQGDDLQLAIEATRSGSSTGQASHAPPGARTPDLAPATPQKQRSGERRPAVLLRSSSYTTPVKAAPPVQQRSLFRAASARACSTPRDRAAAAHSLTVTSPRALFLASPARGLSTCGSSVSTANPCSPSTQPSAVSSAGRLCSPLLARRSAALPHGTPPLVATPEQIECTADGSAQGGLPRCGFLLPGLPHAIHDELARPFQQRRHKRAAAPSPVELSPATLWLANL